MNTKKIKEIPKGKVKLYIDDSIILDMINRKSERVMTISDKAHICPSLKMDPFLNIEISLRRCERVGLFKK